ncbi:hypothetical protein TB2_004561 [Malus domestica]|uniref:Reverse transcriptase domain-containing protein n=1 Tax=Malus domestica TaxID=3750 RepID=A0A498IXK7_MALDO|nr:hypothetical protein DVH24_017475 [Malus domestica]
MVALHPAAVAQATAVKARPARPVLAPQARPNRNLLFSVGQGILFPNLTGFLSKFGLWVLAYQRSCAHVTGMFPPRSAIHSRVLHDLLSLRNAVVRGSFSWNKKTQQYIRSPNDKPSKEMVSKRKLRAMLEADEPCFQDRVVQEVLLMILEPVFGAWFSPKSHAFRPGRNAHTVIRTIRSNFPGYLWFLKEISVRFFTMWIGIT